MSEAVKVREPSFQVTFDPDLRIFINRFAGYPTVDHLFAAMTAVRGNVNYDVVVPALWDFRQASLSRIDTAEVFRFKEISAGIKDAPRPAPIAFVAATRLDHGIIRQIIGSSAWVEQVYEIFNEYDQAMNWLETERES